MKKTTKSSSFVPAGRAYDRSDVDVVLVDVAADPGWDEEVATGVREEQHELAGSAAEDRPEQHELLAKEASDGLDDWQQVDGA